jgi:DNA polymerase-4
VRLLGVGVGTLQAPPQPDLFSAHQPESRLDATIDGIRDRFGTALLTRASLLPRGR